MEIVNPTINQKLKEKEQFSINNYEKQNENSLMKKVKIKNEFLDELEKIEKKNLKRYMERVKARMVGYYEEKPTKNLTKYRNNKVGETEPTTENMAKILKQKKPKKSSDINNKSKKVDNYKKNIRVNERKY